MAINPDRAFSSIPPTTSDSSLSAHELAPAGQTPIEPEDRHLSPIPAAPFPPIGPLPPPRAPRPRADGATPEDIRRAFESPVDRLRRLNDEIILTLHDLEDSRQPRLPDCIYDGLRRCAAEMREMIAVFDHPHIMTDPTPDPGRFIPEGTSSNTQQP
jgi:hypothetical protein